MEICVLRKLLFGGSPLEIVTGNASVHLLKITGEKKSIFDYFEVFVCYCIIWGLVDGVTLFDLTCFLWSVLSSRVIFLHHLN